MASKKHASSRTSSPLAGSPSQRATAQPTEPPDLALRPDLLSAFADDVAARGLVGESTNAQIIFLALVSRVLERPVSITVKGPPSSGKSVLVDSVLKFFPESAYLPLTGMSDKWLAHTREPLAHRFLVIFEASGWTGDFG